MSLINRVLKDVEQHKLKNSKKSTENITAGLAVSVDRNNSKSKHALLLLMLLVVIGLAAVVYHYSFVAKSTLKTSSKDKTALQQIKITQVKTVTKPVVASLTATENNVAFTKVPTVTLEAITFNRDEKEDTNSALFLELSNKTHYAIQHNHDNSQLIVTLANTEIGGSVEKFIVNNWLKSVTYKQAGDDVVITINLQANAKLQKAQLLEQPKYELELGFYHPNPASVQSVIDKKMLPLTPEQKAQQEYKKVLALLGRQQEQMAIIRLRHLLRRVPTYTPARETLATLLYQGGQITETNRVVRIGLRYEPQNLTFTMLCAHMLADRGRVLAALRVLMQTNPSIMQHPDYYGFTAVLYQRQGNYKVAAKLYEQLTKVQPGKAIWWVGLGVALESMGSTNLALEAYQNALKYDVDLDPSVQAYIETKVRNIAQ